MADPAIPAWATPREGTLAVDDAHRLTRQPRSPRTAGVGAALDWARGLDTIPFALPRPQGLPPGYEDYLEVLTAAADIMGDIYSPPNQVEEAGGVTDTLCWLLGWTGPPIPLPHRHPDGTLLSAEDELAVSPAPATDSPEARRDRQRAAEARAARSRILAQ